MSPEYDFPSCESNIIRWNQYPRFNINAGRTIDYTEVQPNHRRGNHSAINSFELSWHCILLRTRLQYTDKCVHCSDIEIIENFLLFATHLRLYELDYFRKFGHNWVWTNYISSCSLSIILAKMYEMILILELMSRFLEADSSPALINCADFYLSSMDVI